MQLKSGDLILFQGDSITEWGRDRTSGIHLGHGYTYMIAAELGRKYPEMQLSFLNRGIGGDRVVDLQRRWQADCLELNPSWVSIMVGINDTWRRFDQGEATSAEAYSEGYRNLLLRAKEHTDARFILLEPFVLPYPEDRLTWREDLDPKIQAVRQLAREFRALYVPLDGIFAAAVCTTASPAYWATDGVHPTAAGHALIAHEWMRRMERPVS